MTVAVMARSARSPLRSTVRATTTDQGVFGTMSTPSNVFSVFPAKDSFLSERVQLV